MIKRQTNSQALLPSTQGKGISIHRSGRIRDMFNQRKIWRALKELEKKNGRGAVDVPVLFQALSISDIDFQEAVEKMVKLDQLILDSRAENHQLIHTVRPYGTPDYYKFLPFWNKVLIEFGLWNLLALIVGIMALIPNTVPNIIVRNLINVVSEVTVNSDVQVQIPPAAQ